MDNNRIFNDGFSFRRNVPPLRNRFAIISVRVGRYRQRYYEYFQFYRGIIHTRGFRRSSAFVAVTLKWIKKNILTDSKFIENIT